MSHRSLVVIACAAVLSACGDSNPSAPGGGSASAGAVSSITLTAAPETVAHSGLDAAAYPWRRDMQLTFQDKEGRAYRLVAISAAAASGFEDAVKIGPTQPGVPVAVPAGRATTVLFPLLFRQELRGGTHDLILRFELVDSADQPLVSSLRVQFKSL